MKVGDEVSIKGILQYFHRSGRVTVRTKGNGDLYVHEDEVEARNGPPGNMPGLAGLRGDPEPAPLTAEDIARHVERGGKYQWRDGLEDVEYRLVPLPAPVSCERCRERDERDADVPFPVGTRVVQKKGSTQGEVLAVHGKWRWVLFDDNDDTPFGVQIVGLALAPAPPPVVEVPADLLARLTATSDDDRAALAALKGEQR